MAELKEEDKPFHTDFEKVLFTMEIQAVQGGLNFGLRVPADAPTPSLHEILGALEYMKTTIILKQWEGNKTTIERIAEKNKSQ